MKNIKQTKKKKKKEVSLKNGIEDELHIQINGWSELKLKFVLLHHLKILPQWYFVMLCSKYFQIINNVSDWNLPS